MKYHVDLRDHSPTAKHRWRAFPLLLAENDKYPDLLDRLQESQPEEWCLVCGPFSSESPKSHWRRLTLTGDIPPSTTFKIFTSTIENGGTFKANRKQSDTAPFGEFTPFFEDELLPQLHEQVSVWQQSLMSDTTESSGTIERNKLTPVYNPTKASLDYEPLQIVLAASGRQLTGLKRPKTQPGLALGEEGSYWHAYPTNVTDTRIWHEPGNRRGTGTKLWVVVLVSGTSIGSECPFKRLTVESYESGWERELPAIYRRPTTDPDLAPEEDKTASTGSLLLDGLLGLFEANADAQQQLIEAVSDWFVPSVTLEPQALARHLGLEVEGLDTAGITKMLSYAFRDFLRRGTVRSFLAALKIFFPHTTIERQDLVEPLLKARLRILGDRKRMVLGDPSVLLAGKRPTAAVVGSTWKEGEATVEPTGLEYLLGRACLRVLDFDFPESEDKRQLMRVIEQFAPAHMKISVQYVGGPAILNRDATVGESIVGS